MIVVITDLLRSVLGCSMERTDCELSFPEEENSSHHLYSLNISPDQQESSSGLMFTTRYCRTVFVIGTTGRL